MGKLCVTLFSFILISLIIENSALFLWKHHSKSCKYLGKTYRHGSYIKKHCETCKCVKGEITSCRSELCLEGVKSKCRVKCGNTRNQVCASNGKLYRNYCEFTKQESCHGNFLKIMPMRHCRKKKRCVRRCSKRSSPCCGSDGQTYSNRCLLRNAQCNHPSLEIRYNGYCKSTIESMCSKIACSNSYKQVCGSDNINYRNSCRLRLAACKKNKKIYIKHNGVCRKSLVPYHLLLN
ncbi:hypothetical protein SNEBB_006138 [Seison nebaliae]|nr:hypothetical protein SNEBB_006138 [Seison nebaliae]